MQPPDVSCVHPLRVQQLLQEQAALLQSLAQGGSISCLPVTDPASCTSMETWSPCGTWIVMQQYQPSKDSRLIIWNTVTGATQDMVEFCQGHFLKVAWLPASPWLLWVKSHDQEREFTYQSIYCLNVATGERHERLNRPYRHCSHSVSQSCQHQAACWRMSTARALSC